MLPELITKIPGPASRELASRLARYENRNVTYLGPGFPIFWERADGVNVLDVDGNRFLDLTAGFAVAAHGHTHPHINAALSEQSAKGFAALYATLLRHQEAA